MFSLKSFLIILHSGKHRLAYKLTLLSEEVGDPTEMVRLRNGTRLVFCEVLTESKRFSRRLATKC